LTVGLVAAYLGEQMHIAHLPAAVAGAATLVALAAVGGASAGARSAPTVCAATGASQGQPASVPLQALTVSAKTIDVRKLPQIAAGKLANGAPPEIGQPGNERAKRLKKDAQANASCVPTSAPTAPAPSP
jgi:hypothetical protein